MRVVLLLIVVLGLVAKSCGSRKVDLNKRVNDLETKINIKIKELEVDRKKLSEYIYTENFRADSIIEENGKRRIYNPSNDKRLEENIEEQEKSKETDQEFSQD